MADHVVELLVDSVFTPVAGGGLLVPQWSESEDLCLLSRVINVVADASTSAAAAATTARWLTAPLSTLQALTSPLTAQAMAQLTECVMDVPELVDKIVPYGSVFPVQQALFADVLREWCLPWWETDVDLACVGVQYEGHCIDAWHLFWQRILPRGVRVPDQNQRTHLLWVESEASAPSLAELRTRLQSGRSTCYVERVQPGPLERYVQLHSQFDTSGFVSSPHSAFPRGVVHFVGRGFRPGGGVVSEPMLAAEAVLAAFLWVHQRLCVRWQRNVRRWQWIQMFPRRTRTECFSNQAVYLQWEDATRGFWEGWLTRHGWVPPQSPRSPHYAPTSPRPLSPYHAPTSPRPVGIDDDNDDDLGARGAVNAKRTNP